MKLCVISFKECWRDSEGRWYSSGGFPLQMGAIGSLFEHTTLMIVEVAAKRGGIRLPEKAQIVPMRGPQGEDLRRKFSVLSSLAYYIKIMWRYCRAADVIHVPLPGDLGFLGLLIALLLRKRLVVRYGGSWPETSQTTLMNRVTKFFMRTFAGGRNVMLATGAGDIPPSKNMHWVFSTVISEREVLDVHPNLDRRVNGRLNLAYVGRLSPEKGIIDLIRAIGLLKSEAESGKTLPCLTIIGDGPQKDHLIALVEECHCGNLIQFAGQLNRQELFNQLAKTDVCVLPSLTEGFPKARLDAMLCGVPVITTEVGFGREVVGADGERGWITPVANAPALSATLKRIQSSSQDWPALRRRCWAYVENCTIEVWTRKIGNICAHQWGLELMEGKLR